MSVRDLLLSCGNIKSHTFVTIVNVKGEQIFKDKFSTLMDNENPQIILLLKSEVDYFKVFEKSGIVILI